MLTIEILYSRAVGHSNITLSYSKKAIKSILNLLGALRIARLPSPKSVTLLLIS